jgi:steroid delta-isomerase-like uncharacterized protein
LLLLAAGVAACGGVGGAQSEIRSTADQEHQTTTEGNRAALQRYLDSNHEDLSMMADDVVFTTMATGEEHRGRDDVKQMLEHVYQVAFDAHAETRTLVVSGDHAVLEAMFVGRHIGEFAGVPATGREVRVPLCVVYDFADGRIQRGRVYFEIPAFLQQVGAAPASR